jgi:hypothetical protein
MKSKKKVSLEKLKKIKTHTFSGKKYKITLDDGLDKKNAWALTDHPREKDRTIYFNSNIEDEFIFISAIIDEGISACKFSIPNHEVDKISDSIARFLMRAGVRAEMEDKKD